MRIYLLCIICLMLNYHVFAEKGYTLHFFPGSHNNVETVAVAGANLALTPLSFASFKNPANYSEDLFKFSFSISNENKEKLNNYFYYTSSNKALVLEGNLKKIILPISIGLSLINFNNKNEYIKSNNNSIIYLNDEFEIAPYFSVKLFDELNMGFSIIFTNGTEKLNYNSIIDNGTAESQKINGQAFSASINLNVNYFNFALSYKTEANLNNNKIIKPIGGVALGLPYKSAEFEIGSSYSLPELTINNQYLYFIKFNPIIMTSLNVIHFPSLTEKSNLYNAQARLLEPVYSFYLDSNNLNNIENNILHNIETRYLPRIAVQTTVISLESIKLSVATGVWREPDLNEIYISRWHLTGGINLAIYALEIFFSVDNAYLYKHMNLGLGLSKLL